MAGQTGDDRSTRLKCVQQKDDQLKRYSAAWTLTLPSDNDDDDDVALVLNPQTAGSKRKTRAQRLRAKRPPPAIPRPAPSRCTYRSAAILQLPPCAAAKPGRAHSSPAPKPLNNVVSTNHFASLFRALSATRSANSSTDRHIDVQTAGPPPPSATVLQLPPSSATLDR
ncbi:hypothetical protein PHBOTO_006625 [Pseudozyma hubeiensis]|nr:hypothetical protein PHBOTO_006625 [Pseudozyma hubeiensis]